MDARLTAERWAFTHFSRGGHAYSKCAKRLIAVDFAQDACVLLAADKAGNVRLFRLGRETLPAQPRRSASDELAPDDGDDSVLGHFSLITDLRVSPCERYVATADRLGHVRVSRFPAVHDIVSIVCGCGADGLSNGAADSATRGEGAIRSSDYISRLAWRSAQQHRPRGGNGSDASPALLAYGTGVRFCAPDVEQLDARRSRNALVTTVHPAASRRRHVTTCAVAGEFELAADAADDDSSELFYGSQGEEGLGSDVCPRTATSICLLPPGMARGARELCVIGNGVAAPALVVVVAATASVGSEDAETAQCVQQALNEALTQCCESLCATSASSSPPPASRFSYRARSHAPTAWLPRLAKCASGGDADDMGNDEDVVERDDNYDDDGDGQARQCGGGSAKRRRPRCT